jgi:Uma2 family endonuclease
VTTADAPSLAQLEELLLNAPEDGSRYEIVHNQLIAMPPAEHNSSVIAAWLTHLLGTIVTAGRLGTLAGSDGAWTLSGPPDANIRAPDLSFVRAGRVPSRAERGPFPAVAPDLVVEVRSPTDRQSRLLEKVGQYLDAGVGLVWLVDPLQRQVTVYHGSGLVTVLQDAQSVLSAPAELPSFAVTSEQVFTPFGQSLD